MKTKKVLALTLMVSLIISGVSTNKVQAKASNKIKLQQKKITISVGNSKRIQVIKSCKKKVKKILKYTSSNVKVAKVNKKGKVTGRKEGIATITVKLKLKNGKKKSLKCKVTVVAKSTETIIPTVVPTAIPTTTASVSHTPAATEPVKTSNVPVVTETPNLSEVLDIKSVTSSAIEADINGEKVMVNVKHIHEMVGGMEDYTMTIASYEDLQAFLYGTEVKEDSSQENDLEMFQGVFDTYDEKYFENNVLIIGNKEFGRGYKLLTDSIVLDDSEKLTCSIDMVPTDQIATSDVVYYLTVIELDKEKAESIKDVEFTYSSEKHNQI